MNAISRKDTVFAMTVADFTSKHKLSPQVRNDLVIVMTEDMMWSATYHKRLRALAKTVSMSDALPAFIQRQQKKYGPGRDLGWTSPKLAAALIASGLTCIDVPALPQTTATPKMLKSLGKENLLATDVRRLGTFSSAAIRAYRYFGDDTLPVTVREVLESSPWSCENSHRFQHVHQSLRLTRERFRELGFTYEDGPFMQDGTRRKFVEKLIAEDSLGKRQASKVADLAMKYRWFPKFTE